MEKEASIKLKSEINELNRVIAFVENICDQYDIYNNYYGNIVTAITEAFYNAVIHGNKLDGTKTINLDFKLQEYGLEFIISDQGQGFDRKSILDPTDNIDNKTGNGLFIIEHLADKVEFDDKGSKIHLKFYISTLNKESADKRTNILKEFFIQKEILENKTRDLNQ